MGTLPSIEKVSEPNTHGIDRVVVKSQAGDRRYRRKNGTYFDNSSSDEVINALERARMSSDRYVIDYGDLKTGISWGETNLTTGYISRSMGVVAIPILVANARSLGGGGILTGNILSIRHANKSKGGYIYKHVNCKS